jgi:hypothetical protein
MPAIAPGGNASSVWSVGALPTHADVPFCERVPVTLIDAVCEAVELSEAVNVPSCDEEGVPEGEAAWLGDPLPVCDPVFVPEGVGDWLAVTLGVDVAVTLGVRTCVGVALGEGAWLAVPDAEDVGVPEPVGDPVAEGVVVCELDRVPLIDALCVPVDDCVAVAVAVRDWLADCVGVCVGVGVREGVPEGDGVAVRVRRAVDDCEDVEDCDGVTEAVAEGDADADAMLIWRIRLLNVSGIRSTGSVGWRCTVRGAFRVASVAVPPSPLKPGEPGLPAKSATAPSVATTRIAWFRVSAM